MTALVSLPSSTQKQVWPADLLEFARAGKVDRYLDPLLQATRELFPTAAIRVYLQKDPELAGVWFIIFEARVPIKDIPDYMAAKRAWTDSLLRIVPGHVNDPFAQHLREVEEE
jgi:hypothetical protein